MRIRLRSLVVLGAPGLVATVMVQASVVQSVALDHPALAAATATAQVAYSPYGSAANAGTLRVVNADGTDDHNVAIPGAADGGPVWNPAGTELAYSDLSTGLTWVVNADGTNAHAVTSRGYLGSVWSPDGTRLAVVDLDGPTLPIWNIAVVDLANGSTTTLAVDNASQSLVLEQPVWSPDGSQLAYITERPGDSSGGARSINIVNADGSGHHVLPEQLDPAFEGSSALAWSPDNEWLAFGGRVSAGNSSRGVLQIAHPDGSGLRTIDSGSATSNGDGTIVGFSPDGSKVLETIVNAQIPTTVAVSTSGSITTMLGAPPTGGFDTAGSWLPNGQGIVYCQGTPNGDNTYTTNLYTSGPNQSGVQQLTTSGDDCGASVSSLSPRYASSDRVGTAISTSRANFTHASSVVIARSDLYPDALAAAPLAGKVQGPILLSPPSGTTTALDAEIKRLGATTAYIIGKDTALSAQVDTDVRADGVTTIVRIGGTTRYDTAEMIAERVGGTAVYVVRGDDFADAASVSGLAAFQSEPILLTPATSLAPQVTAAVAAMHVTSATIGGGVAAVSASAEQTLDADGVSTTRLAGSDRWATSAAVASAAVAAGMSGPPWLASGLNWPDAVSAGPAAAASKGVVLLVAPSSLADSPASAAWLVAHPSNVIVAVGGPAVVSVQDVTAARG